MNQYEHRPTSDQQRVYDSQARAWERESYSRVYGRAATVEADACRTAARNGDTEALREAQRRLSFTLFRDCKWLFGAGG